jgi:hypothetical protein
MKVSEVVRSWKTDCRSQSHRERLRGNVGWWGARNVYQCVSKAEARDNQADDGNKSVFSEPQKGAVEFLFIAVTERRGQDLFQECS